MKRLSVLLFALLLQMTTALAQTEEAHRNGKLLVNEFNDYSEKLMDSHRGYDLRPVYNGMADFIMAKMKKQNLALVVHSLYLGSNEKDSVTYHLIDSIDSRNPKLVAKLQIYFTGPLDPITAMYYISGAFFKNHGTKLKKVRLSRDSRGKFINVNAALKDIVVSDAYDIYLVK